MCQALEGLDGRAALHLCPAGEAVNDSWICDGCCRRFDSSASQGATNTTVEEVRLRAEVARLRSELQLIADMYPDGPTACSLAESALISTSAPIPNKSTKTP